MLGFKGIEYLCQAEAELCVEYIFYNISFA